MFYFGGMTLGYLTPPRQPAQPEDGGKMAKVPQDDQPATARDAARDKTDLIARANWFSLYW